MEIDKQWKGPAKVIRSDGKTIVVKHGGTLRDVTSVCITRLAGIPRILNNREVDNNKVDEGKKQREWDWDFERGIDSEWQMVQVAENQSDGEEEQEGVKIPEKI